MISLNINAIIAGLAIGSIYGLIAVGYTIVFNATNVFNLAQGDFVMVGVMLSYLSLDVMHWPQIVALLVAVGGVMAIALFEERVVVRRFLRRSSHDIGWFIATLGFSVIIESVATILYGTRPVQAIPSPLPDGPVSIGSISTRPQYLLGLGVLAAVTVGVELFYRRTWTGVAMRATAQNREIAAMRGIKPNRVSMLAFGLAGLIGGLSGYVIAPVVSSDVTIGLTYALSGFVALAIGGFGSIRGSLAGALILGVGEQLFDLHGNAQYQVLADLAILSVVLLVRPSGIFRSSAARTV
jgi:branched-chain amino acid transport system permease protein